MAKNRKARKTQKQRKATAYQIDYLAEIKLSLTHHRAQKALVLLKAALKNKVTLDESLIGQVYLLRLRDLLEHGDSNGAQQFYNAQLAGTPYWHERVDLADQYMLHFQMELYERWFAYGQDAEIDAVIDQLILTTVKDFRPFIEKMGLPTDHPLKTQAQSILNAWEMIDAGNDDNVASTLNKVGRHSPFRAWRLLLQALSAYYRNDQLTLKKNLSRLPENSAIQSLADHLQQLESGDNHLAADQSAVLMFSLKGSRRYELMMAEKMLTTRQFKTAVNKINIISKNFEAEGQFQLACEISSMVNCGNLRSIPSQRYFIALRKANREEDPNERRCMLESVFRDITTKTPLIDDIDYAVLLTKIAKLWYKFHLSSGYEFVTCGGDPTWTPCEESDIERLCAGCVIKQAKSICQQALSYYPLEKSYQLYVNIMELDPKLEGMAPVLHAWLKDFPSSITALQRSLELFIKLGNWSEAESMLKKVREKVGNSQALQDRRFDLATREALSLCVAGNNTLLAVNALLDSVQNQTGWKQVLLDTIRWRACGSDKKTKQQHGILLAQYNSPYLIFYFCRTATPKFRKQHLPKPVLKQLSSTGEAVLSGLEAITSLPMPYSSDNTTIDDLLALTVPKSILRKIEGCPELFCRLFLLYLKAEEPLNFPQNAYKTSAKFLSANHAHVAEFWGLRGLLYYHEYRENGDRWGEHPDVFDECLMMAYHYGLKSDVIINKYKAFGINLPIFIEKALHLTDSEIQQVTLREQKRTREKDLVSAVKGDNSAVKVALSGKFAMLCEELDVSLDMDITVIQQHKINIIVEGFFNHSLDEVPMELLPLLMDLAMSHDGDPASAAKAILEAIIAYVLKDDDVC